MLPWSPLAFGFLTGKYDREAVESASPRAGGLPRETATDDQKRPDGDKRLDGSNPFGDSLFTERNWAIVDELKRIAQEAGQSPARVALAWVTRRQAVTSTLMGVSGVHQLLDNIAALGIELSDAHMSALNKISLSQARMLYSLFSPTVRQHAVFGGDTVTAWGTLEKKAVP